MIQEFDKAIRHDQSLALYHYNRGKAHSKSAERCPDFGQQLSAFSHAKRDLVEAARRGGGHTLNEKTQQRLHAISVQLAAMAVRTMETGQLSYNAQVRLDRCASSPIIQAHS